MTPGDHVLTESEAANGDPSRIRRAGRAALRPLVDFLNHRFEYVHDDLSAVRADLATGLSSLEQTLLVRTSPLHTYNNAANALLTTTVALMERLDLSLTVVDVGCRFGFAEAWSRFGEHGRVIGFDADPVECERLRAYYGDRVGVYPVALGATSGTGTVYMTAEPACSSLYRPDEAMIELHPQLREIAVVDTQTVELVTFDEWAAGADEPCERVDVFKVDTQGSELGVLQGAERALGSVRVIEVEVEFNPIYEGQPLFSDVDRFLRERGFVLWRLSHLMHYSQHRGLAAASDLVAFESEPAWLRAHGGQIFWGDAYYVAEDLAYGNATGGDWATCVRDAAVTSALGFDDLAMRALDRARASAPRDVAEVIDGVVSASR